MTEFLGPNDVRLLGGETSFGGRYRVTTATMSGAVVAAKSVISAQNEDARRTDSDLEHEHLMMARLDHRAIPKTKGLWRDPATGLLYHIMEFREGKKLEAVVQARTEKNAGRAATILLERDEPLLDLLGQVFGALAYAHDRGVVHNDLSPRNIQVHLTEDFEVVASLIDFEASAVPERGTLPYAAPEKMAKGFKPSVQADIFSAGVLMFYVLTGVVPWPPSTHVVEARERQEHPLNNLRDDVSRRAWRQIEDMPEHIGKALLRATHHDPAERQTSVQQLMRELRIALVVPPARRQPLLTWMGGAVSVAAAVFLLSPLQSSVSRALLQSDGRPLSRCQSAIRSDIDRLCQTHPLGPKRTACSQQLLAVLSQVEESRCTEQRAELRRLIRSAEPQRQGSR